ncbi:hypothetical protein, conserved [Eimeria brunetti]|uniref:Uncharacterized protein n=1 Tax=Eimeria brunetti TaxID=51314 RepID=U6M1W6_9EIME|nr:hypothetical protein, conserved [Eimeria brunetti]
MSTDDLIRNFFKFLPPGQLIHGNNEKPFQTSFVELTPEETAPADTEPSPPADDQPEEPRPLRTIHFASDAKHILAYIIRSVYSHFRGPTCQQIAKQMDGAGRFLLRNNSKAAVMEPLLVYSLIQGNAESAFKFEKARSSLEYISDYATQTLHTGANKSLRPGIYDPVLLVSYFDLAKSGYTNDVKILEKYLDKPVDERVVASMLFGNSLANPVTHKKVTEVGRAVGVDEELLQRVVERIGFLAVDSSDAVSVLMPDAPKVAAFLRGVSFFVFENVFKQNGPYVMPGLPCGGNLTGSMLETFTGKNLGKKYLVYKYTQPLQGSPILPESVWTPDPESQVARSLKESQPAEADYLYRHLPRVCVRASLFKKCAKKPPSDTRTNEQRLCHFINTHQSFFFEVDGGGVNTLRRSMQKGRLSRGRLSRMGSALKRSVQAIRRFFFNKTSVALVLGVGVGALCAASGLAGILGGSVCAVGAVETTSFFRTFFAVTPFGAKPSIPLSLGTFLASEFDRNLDIASTMLGVPLINHTHAANMGEAAVAE